MLVKKLRAGAAASLVAAALVGGLGATLAPAVATAAPIVALRETPAPGAGDLNAKLQTALNQGNDRGTRASVLEAGEAGLPLIDQIGMVMATVPSFRWSIIDATTNGDTTDATLRVTVDGFDPFFIPTTWRDIDGSWKLTRESECNLAYYASLPCSV